jgi:predicted amidohydrolase YtcJ
VVVAAASPAAVAAAVAVVAGNHSIFIATASLIVACGTEQATEPVLPADRIFVNAAVYTVDAGRNWAEAVAVRDGEIVYVGDTEGAGRLADSDTEVLDLGGKMLMPGFHDSHVHILIGKYTDEYCDLEMLETVDAIVERLQECVKLDGFGADRWIDGGIWLDHLFPEANPHKDLLDEFFPDRPVYLDSSYGHSAWVNSLALEIADIHIETQNPEAGVIERDPETGEATGTLRDSAMMLVRDIMPEPTLENRIEMVRAAVTYAQSYGITSVIEPGLDGDLLEPVVALADRGEFDLRAMVALSPIGWQPGRFGDEIYDMLEQREQWRRPNVNVDSIKIYMDGVIEYGTAAVLEPYDMTKWGEGLRFYSQEQVNEYLTQFDSMGINIQVHAIGDAGIRMALDGFEAMRRANGHSGNRHQVVHLQLIDDAEISRFGELDIGANFQALWAYPDESVTDLAFPAIGVDRSMRTYPIARVAQAGGRIVAGSDYSVTSINPLPAIEVAITRQDPDTNEAPSLNADEAVDLETMIAAYTINGAYQMGLDDVQGSIEVGKRADLVVLDRNLFEIPVSEISEASVLMTIFDGRTVYERMPD